MNVKYLSAMLSAALLTAGLACADEQKSKQTDQTGTDESGQMRRGDRGSPMQSHHDKDTWIGRVKEYEPGKKLELEIQEGMDKTFDLSEQDVKADVAADVKVGSMVKVTQTEKDGQKLIHVTPHKGSAKADGPKKTDKK